MLVTVFLKEGEKGPSVLDLASEATPRILLVISPDKDRSQHFTSNLLLVYLCTALYSAYTSFGVLFGLPKSDFRAIGYKIICDHIDIVQHKKSE